MFHSDWCYEYLLWHPHTSQIDWQVKSKFRESNLIIFNMNRPAPVQSYTFYHDIATWDHSWLAIVGIFGKLAAIKFGKIVKKRFGKFCDFFVSWWFWFSNVWRNCMVCNIVSCWPARQVLVCENSHAKLTAVFKAIMSTKIHGAPQSESNKTISSKLVEPVHVITMNTCHPMHPASQICSHMTGCVAS